jgi:MerR family transcriptional regulator/heat shock protein HspR
MGIFNKSSSREPRYVISVAARLADTTPHSLRAYEKAGLIKPARTEGKLRLYSDEDIERLRQIRALTRKGVNLAGVKVILETDARKGRR